MQKLLILTLLTLSTSATFAEATVLRVSRVSSTSEQLNVEIQNAPLSSVIRALELHLTKPVTIETAGSDRLVSFRARAIQADEVLQAVVEAEQLTLEDREGWLAIRDPREPTVTLDVKDAELSALLSELKKQCGIRNIVVDPDVGERKGTFLFHEVPCSVAFNVIFNSLGLAAQLETNSVLQVENRRQ